VDRTTNCDQNRKSEKREILPSFWKSWHGVRWWRWWCMCCWGRSVMLEQPRRSSSSRVVSHMLTSHGGEIYIHALITSRSILEDPPSISEGAGGRLTDYRISVSSGHLTTSNSKAMVIVWRFRGNTITSVLYWQRATYSMGTVIKNSSYSPVWPWACLFVFLGCMIYLYVCVYFVLPWDSWVISLHALALA